MNNHSIRRLELRIKIPELLELEILEQRGKGENFPVKGIFLKTR